jgi:hypothetical protein
MSSSIQALLALVGDPGAYEKPAHELRPLQLAAVNERFEALVDRIPLLRNRARDNGITGIRTASDLVPLLFAHTAYKSYPESWIADNQWDRMGKWLQTVSANPVGTLDLEGVTDLDQWIQRLETVGHYVTCSSGTTGKPALISCSKQDLDYSGRISVAALSWALGIEPTGDFKLMGVGGTSKAARSTAVSDYMINAFSSPETAYMPGFEITIGQISKMISMRRKVVEGMATPDEIAAFEQVAKLRTAAMEGLQAATVKDYIDSREHKMLIGGMWGLLFPIAEGIRAQGYGGKDFHPDNVLFIAGGLKRTSLPADFMTTVLETFNVKPSRLHQVYAMQEMNAQFPRCRAGRYHIPAWVMLIMLNDAGDAVLDTRPVGEIKGRAAFYDFSIEGRWGGVISGDKVSADYGVCACGHQGPTVGPDIVRYADLESGDKLSCSGTMDAYMRGEA